MEIGSDTHCRLLIKLTFLAIKLNKFPNNKSSKPGPYLLSLSHLLTSNAFVRRKNLFLAMLCFMTMSQTNNKPGQMNQLMLISVWFCFDRGGFLLTSFCCFSLFNKYIFQYIIPLKYMDIYNYTVLLTTIVVKLSTQLLLNNNQVKAYF